jgi:hypothetical protein
MLFAVLIACCGSTAQAIELYFTPDSSFAAVGDTIQLSARITASDTLRGFSVYMVYDTNQIDLVGVPIPGPLIASRAGLDFRYADHIVSAPDWLEVGATVFSTDYWAGPGELFQMSMVMRGCGDLTMTAELGFRRPSGEYIPGDFTSPVFLVCDRVPADPGHVVISPLPVGVVSLRWNQVRLDTLGRPILYPVIYDLHRQQILPSMGPDLVIVSTADTTYIDPLDGTESYNYTVTAIVTP